MSDVTLKKTDLERRLVYGEVYAPDRPDVDGEFMTSDEIENMAHLFLYNGLQDQIDVQHGNKPIPMVSIVESFIAREGDTDFIPGAWVVCCYVNDDTVWEKVKSGELNGFSVQAAVRKESVEVEVEIPDLVTGQTSEVNDHTHTFQVRFGVEGSFLGGATDTVNGHYHRISAGTITDNSNGHRHRFSSVDNVQIVPPVES